MKKLLFFAAMIYFLNSHAQNYQITFTGTGASATVESVKVENLTAGTTVTLNSGDILRLNVTTGISPDIYNVQSSEIKVFPNPSHGSVNIQFTPLCEGDAVISLYDITGRQLTRITHFMENHIQEFQINGLGNGLHLIIVKGKTYNYSTKALSNSNLATNIISLQRISTISAVSEKADDDKAKGSSGTVEMLYTTGDRLKFTGKSGNYSTVMTDVPTESKTITFNFIACTDGQGNNYPIVKIGSQTWMAENLKTTKYNDGSDIPLITDNTQWQSITTPGYCWYENDASINKNTYGALYNWFAVNTGKLCPTGWHVPTITQWTKLTDYLGGESVAGGKLKETGTTHWQSPNTEATNETGFTALPGGSRFGDGTFHYIGDYGFWWSATLFGSLAYIPNVIYDYGIVGIGRSSKEVGSSVRCVRD